MIVHNKGKYIRHIGVRLLPGASELNETEEKAFEAAIKQPLNAFLVKEGEIVLPEGKQGGQATGITAMNVKNATELIKDTFDLSLLDKWSSDETSEENRKGVLDAINKQIEAIKNPPDDKVVKGEE